MAYRFAQFQSTLPTRGSDQFIIGKVRPKMRFNPRSPRGGATVIFIPCLTSFCVSIHAPHEGERLTQFCLKSFCIRFNPRSPRGGATSLLFNPHRLTTVSIHAPHEGERLPWLMPNAQYPSVSIHAPHEGERRRKSAFVCSISANLLNIIHCGTVTRAVSRRRIALFRLFSVRRSGVFMYAYASH